MKNFVINLILILGFLLQLSCQEPEEKNMATDILLQRIDSLENRINVLEMNSKPRLSVFMNRMQIHHSRMWNPGISGNWSLLSYEWAKTKETLSDIKMAHGNNPHGSSTIGLELDNLQTTIDSLEQAILNKSKDDFVKSYQTLTSRCNSCHKAAGLDFYEIIKPVKPAYSGEME